VLANCEASSMVQAVRRAVCTRASASYSTSSVWPALPSKAHFLQVSLETLGTSAVVPAMRIPVQLLHSSSLPHCSCPALAAYCPHPSLNAGFFQAGCTHGGCALTFGRANEFYVLVPQHPSLKGLSSPEPFFVLGLPASSGELAEFA
jgi:hypothetical protein